MLVRTEFPAAEQLSLGSGLGACGLLGGGHKLWGAAAGGTGRSAEARRRGAVGEQVVSDLG